RSTDDFMVVSDINAAMGLFHQSMIIDVTTKYETLIKEKDEILRGLKESGAPAKEVKKAENEYAQRIEEVLSAFAVEVYALEGEEVFARISTCFRNGGLMREIRIFDFNGRILHRIEPKSINLTPPHVHKDLDKSFFESHLEEVPTLLENQLGTKFLEDGSFSGFPVNVTPMKRKFGKNLKNLDRILLIGMGTSNHASMFAAGFAKTLLEKVQVVCIEPVQVDMLSRLIEPERDFVLLVSWSATTAEMVKIARDLLSLNVLFAGVTEKTFGDMALVAKKSCGIVPVMSGEEVTIPAVKSTFCSVMAVDLFMLWLCSDLMELELDQTVYGSIKQIPGVVRQVLSDPSVKQCAEKLSAAHVGADMFVVIDALHTRGCGHEAAMKMEELTWSVMAKGIDYRDIEMDLLYLHNDKTFLIVNATDRERILEAVEVMSFLDKENIPFFAVTYEGSRLETVEQLSHGNLLVLPKCADCFQPFADLVFYYMLAFYSARAMGRRADDYPRNRAKSVTTSRSVAPAEFSPAGELFNVRHREDLLSNVPVLTLDVNDSLAWEENQGFTRRTREYFSLMKHLAWKLAGTDPLESFVSYEEQALETFSQALFDRERDLELLFFPMDNTADAAVRNTVGKLFRFLPCRMRVLQRGEALDSVKGDAIIMAVASFSQSLHFPNELDRENICDIGWFGPRAIVEGMEAEAFPMGRYIVNSDVEGVGGSALYAGLVLMLLKAWQFSEPAKAADLETHFKRSGQVIGDMLNDTDLARDAARVMAANGAYRTMLYLSPPDGTGLDFTRKFDKAGKIATKNIFFGEAAHGSLVTVDNRVDEKFIHLTTRNQMVEEYGANKVNAWEKTYMNGEDIDAYLENLTNDLASRVESPFFAEGYWYLPLLKPEYAASQDNLIVVDATSERYFDQAADDLAVFGCRHARLMVITQEAFLGMPEKRSIQKFPLAGMLKIPSFKAKGQIIPVSDLHLPFAVNLVSAAMAGMENSHTTDSPRQ
ncbi:MAG TPA: hypothetical protein VJ936_01055, partial [Desulfobacteraceae bacterium]|nr:hypothetical protein [Desulfobacteraceae bacterium]